MYQYRVINEAVYLRRLQHNTCRIGWKDLSRIDEDIYEDLRPIMWILQTNYGNVGAKAPWLLEYT